MTSFYPLQETPVLDMTATLEDLPIDGPENKVVEQIKVYIQSGGQQISADAPSVNSTEPPAQQPQDSATRESPISQVSLGFRTRRKVL